MTYTVFRALPVAAPPRGTPRTKGSGREGRALLNARAVRAVPWLVLLALFVLLNGLPNGGDANYYVSVRASGHDYSSPARCVARREGRFDCTPLQRLPVGEGTFTGLAAPLFARGPALSCEVSPRPSFACTPYPLRSAEQAGPGL